MRARGVSGEGASSGKNAAPLASLQPVWPPSPMKIAPSPVGSRPPVGSPHEHRCNPWDRNWPCDRLSPCRWSPRGGPPFGGLAAAHEMAMAHGAAGTYAARSHKIAQTQVITATHRIAPSNGSTLR